VPVYSYACQDCGHDFEQRQSITDAALTVCPECEGTLHKIISAVGVVFKGSGFYRTDSRGAGRPGKRGVADDARETVKADGGSAGDTGAKADCGTTSNGGAPGAASKPGTDGKPAAGSGGPNTSKSASPASPAAHAAA
jgi:putative FmdB family regulatory protein